jgi:hypothetical protein
LSCPSRRRSGPPQASPGSFYPSTRPLISGPASHHSGLNYSARDAAQGSQGALPTATSE